MILTVLGHALDLARARLATLFTAGWAYMLLLLVLNVAITLRLMPASGFTTGSYLMEPIPDLADAGRQAATLRLLAVVANVIAGFSIGVAYLRRVLLGRREFPLAFGPRNLRAGWKLLLLWLLGMVVLAPLLVVSALLVAVLPPVGLGGLAASGLVAMWVVQRLSLVLPAAALDDRMTLGESWEFTQGIGLALTVGGVVIGLAALVAAGLWWGLVALAEGLAGVLLSAVLAGPALAEADRMAGVLRSALLPAGAMVIVTWLFASLQATSYALARKRFIAEAGLRQREAERAEEMRMQARSRAARRAVSSVLDLGRRGDGG